SVERITKCYVAIRPHGWRRARKQKDMESMELLVVLFGQLLRCLFTDMSEEEPVQQELLESVEEEKRIGIDLTKDSSQKSELADALVVYCNEIRRECVQGIPPRLNVALVAIENVCLV